MSTIITIISLFLALILGFITGRYTRGWGMSEKEQQIWRDVGAKIKLVERSKIFSPSKVAQNKKDLEDMTNE